MARVEQDEKPSPRSSEPRQSEENRPDQIGVTHTPDKAEGSERDAEEALRRKNEH